MSFLFRLMGALGRGVNVRAWLALALMLAAAASAGAQTPPPAAVALSMQGPSVVPLAGLAQTFIDPRGALSIDDVAQNAEQLNWRPLRAEERLSIDGAALWIRFDAQVRNPEERWFLEFADSGVDRVTLYVRRPNGSWLVQEAGDVKPVKAWPVPGRFVTFPLGGSATQPVRYWLRVEHARVPFSTPINLVRGATLAANRDAEQFLLGGYFGLVSLVTLLSLGLAWAWRDRLMIAYALYVVSVGLSQLAQLGTGAQYVWPNALLWNRLSTFVLPALSAAAGLWFIRRLTEPARSSRLLDRVVVALVAGEVALVVLDAFRPLGATYQLIGYLILLMMVLAVLMMVLAWRRADDPHVRLAILGFLPLLLMALFPLARTLDLIATSVFTRYGMTIGAALEMPILLYAISMRASARREATVRAEASATTDALTGLANRRVLLVRLDGALQRARRQDTQFALIGVYVANWRAIARQHGDQAAERALVLAASRLRRMLRDGDVAARVGENAIALLIDSRTTREQALEFARQAQAQSARGSALLAKGEALEFGVALALLPHSAGDAPTTLRRVLDGARAAAEGGRDVRVLD